MALAWPRQLLHRDCSPTAYKLTQNRRETQLSSNMPPSLKSGSGVPGRRVCAGPQSLHPHSVADQDDSGTGLGLDPPHEGVELSEKVADERKYIQSVLNIVCIGMPGFGDGVRVKLHCARSPVVRIRLPLWSVYSPNINT